jgi:hypothetical protein
VGGGCIARVTCLRGAPLSLERKLLSCFYVGVVGKPTPCFLDECEALGFVHGERRWRSHNGRRLYTWDDFHGEIEVFTKRGVHLGAADAVTGIVFKPAKKGRTIDV